MKNNPPCKEGKMNIVGLLQCFVTPSVLITQLISAVSIAMILFLVASGLSLIFGVLGLSNFAHGSFYMIGAYVTYTITSALGYFWLALILAPITVGVLGLLMERFLVRRIYGSPHIFQFLLTFGCLLILDDGARFIWGFDYRSTGTPALFQRPPLAFFGSAIPTYYVFIIVMGIFVALGLWIVLSKTQFGKLVNAAASDSDMTECLGIDVRLVYTLVFGVGALLAGFAGVLAAPLRPAVPGMGFSIIIESFIVMVVGGVGSIKGVLLASFMIGLLRSFGSIGFPDYELFFPFFLVIVVLLIRPWGLFGNPIEE